jgi:putative inorganic carbon (HCO3(-)) transporter
MRLNAGRWGQRLQEAGLYVLLVLLPFSKSAIEVLFGVLLLGWVLERCDPATRRASVWFSAPFRRLTWAGAAFLAVCALSILVSRYPRHSVQGLVEKWAEYLLFAVIAADLGRRPRVVRRGLTALALSALLVVIEAVWQEVFGKGLLRGYPIWGYMRMTGPYENPIDLATYLVVVIPLLLGDAAARTGWRRWAQVGLLLALIACLGRTEASGAWLGLFVGTAAMSLWRRPLRRYGAALLLCVAVAAGAWLHASGRLRDAFSARDAGTVDRWDMWQAALGMIRDRPVLGHGVNTFMANYMAYRVGGEPQPRYAHNCYLQVAAETGLVGLAAFLWLLWGLWRGIWSGARTALTPDSMWLLGCAAGLTAFAVQAALDTNFYALRQAALFWTLAGLGLGWSGSRAAEAA